MKKIINWLGDNICFLFSGILYMQDNTDSAILFALYAIFILIERKRR